MAGRDSRTGVGKKMDDSAVAVGTGMGKAEDEWGLLTNFKRRREVELRSNVGGTNGM